MILIVCSSVFQLYVAINIKETFLKEETVDLILTDSTPIFRSLHANEKLKSLFHNVRFVPINENVDKLNRLEKSKYGQMFFEIFPRCYAKKVWETDIRKYKECYFSSYTKHKVLLQYAIKRNRKNTKIHMFEDGISTYIVKNGQTIRTPRLLRKIFNIHSIEELISDVYVFEPELVCLQEYSNLITLPKPKEVEGLSQIYNEIFGKIDYTIKEKFIFFEESFNNDGYVTNDAELIHTLFENVEAGNCILKHHPRNKIDRFKTSLPTIEAPIFWENYFLNDSIDDKILVTVSSNTVFVPHIIAGACPMVVLLYKIFDGTSPILGSPHFKMYVEKYLEYYEDYTKTKFYIPETIEEFKEIIQKLKRENEV